MHKVFLRFVIIVVNLRAHRTQFVIHRIQRNLRRKFVDQLHVAHRNRFAPVEVACRKHDPQPYCVFQFLFRRSDNALFAVFAYHRPLKRAERNHIRAVKSLGNNVSAFAHRGICFQIPLAVDQVEIIIRSRAVAVPAVRNRRAVLTAHAQFEFDFAVAFQGSRIKVERKRFVPRNVAVFVPALRHDFLPHVIARRGSSFRRRFSAENDRIFRRVRRRDRNVLFA